MRRIAIILSFALFALAPRSLGQTGFPAFGSFEQSGFDAVNRQNLNAIFAIPIMSTPGRGQTFQYTLVNNSLLWAKTTVGSTTSWTPVTDASGNPTWGWTYGPAVSGAGQVLYNFQATSPHCRYLDPNTGNYYLIYWQLDIYSNFRYKDWLGSIHPFSGSFYVTISNQNAETYCGVQSGTTGPLTGYSTDNTGFSLYASQNSTYVLSPSGVNAGAAPVDTNGNYVSQTVVNSTETDWTDTYGHLALKVLTNTSNPNIQYQWQDSGGNYSSGATTTTVQVSTLSIKTNFGCSGVTNYTGTANLPTEIDLPNSQKYLITYEPTPNNSGYYTGRVLRVTLPTGGYYEYDYTGSNDSVNCSDGSTMQMNRVMNDGTNTSTWSFSRSGSVTTVTAPQMPYDGAANSAAYTFSGTQQTTAQFYQGAALMRTISTTWASNGSPATQTTLLEDGKTENEVETSYDNYGNLLSVKEHDWGVNNTPGSVLRTTVTTYLGTSPYITANILNRPTSVTVTDNVSGIVHSLTNIAYDETAYTNYGTCRTGVPQHSDTFGCSFTTRGNPTTVTTYITAATQAGPVYHHSYYDNLGNLVRADMDCCQSKTWAYSSTTNYSFPDSSTRGSSPGTQLTTSATYNQYTGLTATSTDENNQVTNYTFDNLKRLTVLKRPDNTQLTWSYTDATPPTQSSVTAGVPIQGSNVQNTITTVDGLGRAVTQKLSDGTTTYSIVGTQYDPIGRAYMTSNPYTSTAQYWTTSKFDALGRPTYTVLQDNSQITFSYSTNTATVTDPAGKARKSIADGLGRMTSIYEPDPTNGNSLTLQTSYTYNVSDILTGVTQGSQTRTYAYDDLGRATSVKTPETNQAAYQYVYNSFGLVTQRTDPRGVITTYGFDNLNRLTGITYNVGTTGVTATPGVTLTYDQGGSAAYALGRLTSMTDGVGSETYAYNNLGEMTQLQKVINGTTYTTGYAYNLAGELSSITYPSTRVVQQSFDTIGRLCAVGNTGSTCSSGTTFASGYSYNAAFQVTGFNYGNGVAAAFGYTADRLLLQSLAYTKGSTALFSTNYWYKTDSTNCPSAASGNNGQIQCITDNMDSGRTVSYSFDALYRITAATTNGSSNYAKWGVQWTYDRYGNRLSQSQTYDAPPTNSVTVSAATNQITGSPYAYDANGNMTNDGNNTLVYDAENRVLSATNGGAGGTYTYDGNNLRVQKTSGGSTTIYIFSGSKVIAEYDGESGVRKEYIYAGSQILASVGGTGISNGGFEQGATGWNLCGGGTQTQIITDSTRAHSGSNYVQMSTSTAACAVNNQFLPVSTGDQVLWGGWAYLESGNGLVHWNMIAYDINKNPVNYLGPSPTNVSAAAWTYQVGSYTVPSGVAYVVVYAEVWNATVPTVARFDDGFITVGTHYYHQDHLSNRLVTDSSGNTLEQLGHYPFGESWYNASNDKLLFTSYERDAESGNDYAMMRYGVNRLGRFSSPDPVSGVLGDPQSLSHYSYALNDPIDFIDPWGLDPCDNDPNDCVSVSADPLDGGDPSASLGEGGLDSPPPLLRYRGGRGGGGTTIGPIGPPQMGPRKPVVCSASDLIFGSLEFSFKMGLETNLGSVAKLGGSFFKNFTTGETGASAGIKAIVGYEIGSKNPPGVPITTPGAPVTHTVSLGPLQKNLTTGETSASYSLSVVVGIGGEVTFNATKYKELASHCDIIVD